MLNIVKKLLLKIVDDIDAGNSNMSETEALETIDYLDKVTNKKRRLSKYEACQYLNVSRVTFDNYVKAGKLPKGMKQAGFKELFWYKKDLYKFIKECKK